MAPGLSPLFRIASFHTNEVVAFHTIQIPSPSIWVGHLRPLLTNPSDTVNPISNCSYFSHRLQIKPVPNSTTARELRTLSLTYLHRSHFSIYGPEFQLKRLDI
ncbi:hypothetical protein AVEN_108914-1 [Araneus ventricosus]|uniref:Uncharacterized protein n=1 Tax=Araneus ventricosus TaxID=182803 RepID=A0A4Y2LAF6_ARAVE|nr:hypothetical protein AVEN_108914-1 [Araneus ventricosus]